MFRFGLFYLLDVADGLGLPAVLAVEHRLQVLVQVLAHSLSDLRYWDLQTFKESSPYWYIWTYGQVIHRNSPALLQGHLREVGWI